MEITYNGLQAWYKNTFENFGWMILSHENAIYSYYQEIIFLEITLKNKLSTLEQNDNINDTQIMINNIHKLKQFIEKNFDFSKYNTNISRSNSKINNKKGSKKQNHK